MYNVNLSGYDVLKNVISTTKNDSFAHYNYLLCPAGLYLNYDAESDFYWEMTIDNQTYKSDNLKDLMDLFIEIHKELKNIKVDNEVKITVLPVYCYRLKELSEFFKYIISNSDPDNSYEVILKNIIVLRDVSNIVPLSDLDDLGKNFLYKNGSYSYLLKEFAKVAFNDFISDNKLFKTAASKAKNTIKENIPEDHKNWFSSLNPYPNDYFFIRYNCFRASVCMNHFYNKVYSDVHSFDQSSAHAHKLVCKQFPITKPRHIHQFDSDFHDYKESIEDMNYYLNKYWCWFNAKLYNVRIKQEAYGLNPFKIKNENCMIAFDQLQWEAFNMYYEYDSVEFSDLIISDKGYLPDWLRCVIADMYLDKAKYTIKDGHRNMLKVILNAGSYGITIQKLYNYWEDEENKIPKNFSNSQWSDVWKNRLVPPTVGCSITSYVLYDELSIIIKDAYKFAYCDTDSIKFEDSDIILSAINDRNNESMAEVKEFCDKFNYDYELMKELGLYKNDANYKQFKSISPKEYIYITDDNKYGSTCAGYACHYKADPEWNCKESKIPVILYEPLSKGLDPFKMFTPYYKYYDYKIVWDPEHLCTYKAWFKLNNYENAIKYKELEDNYKNKKGMS